MMKILKTICIAFVFANQLSALDIKVSANNNTLNEPLRYANKISIIKLNESMQVVSSKTEAALPVVFSGLPAMENSPYMIQITYKAVNYNKVVSPNTPGNLVDVNIDVYEATNVFSSEINLEKYIEINYYENVLATDITHHFTNTGKYTFTERGSRNGILMYISKGGKNPEAIVETPHSKSDFKSLKLTPIPLPDKPDYYLLDQPVKPGEKDYMARAYYNYDGNPLEITFDNIYPMSKEPLIVLYAKDMTVKWKENPAFDTKAVFDENIGGEIIKMPNRQGKFTLVFSGGKPEQGNGSSSQNSNQQIGAGSPVNKYVKLGGIAAFLFILTGFFYYIKRRPAWLQIMQSKNKSRLEFELKNLQSLNLSPEILAKKEKKLKEKMEAMEKLFKL
jgi:hypothetical protein